MRDHLPEWPLMAIGVTIVLGFAPAALQLATYDCLQSCPLRTAFPMVDAAHIVAHADAISRGVSPLEFSSPPLRYVPLASLIAILRPFGVTSTATTVAYSAIIEFVILPILVFTTAQRWFDERVAGASMLGLLAVMYVLPYPGQATAFARGQFMYAYAAVPFLGALVTATREDGGWATGACLALTALTQLILAVYAAVVVGSTAVWNRNWKRLVTTAGTSIVLSIPLVPFIRSYWDVWFDTGSERTGTLSGGSVRLGTHEVVVVGLLATLGLAGVLALRRAGLVSRLREELPPVLVAAVLFLGTLTVGGRVVEAGWYAWLAGYAGSFVGAIAIGYHLTVAVDALDGSDASKLRSLVPTK